MQCLINRNVRENRESGEVQIIQELIRQYGLSLKDLSLHTERKGPAMEERPSASDIILAYGGQV